MFSVLKKNHFRKQIALFALCLIASIVCVFAGRPCAWATVGQDQEPLSESELAQARANGEILTLEDVSESFSEEPIQTFSASNKSMTSFSGNNRYHTSALQAQGGWPEGSDHAILVSGESWPDALSATGLAGIYDCPILLVSESGIHPEVKDSLVSLGVSKAIIIGGTGVVGKQVEDDLSTLGITLLARLGGSNRFETQLSVYEFAKGSWSSNAIVAVQGAADSGFADALSVSPLAYRQKLPVFLTDGSGNFTPDQETALLSAALNGAFSSSIILGGPSCVSEQAEGFLNSFSQLGGVGGGVVKRIFGANRWETTSKFADWVIGEGYLACNGAGFASGMLPYDALGGGAVQGRTGSVLILVSDSSAASAVNPLQNADVSTVRIYGGKGAVSSAVRLCIATDLGFYPTDIGGLRIYLDAGHGWNSDNNGLFDPGAMSGGYREADLTAELANLVAKELRETYGVEVFVNDDGGWYKLRQEEALSLGCDLLVSIHFNAGGGTGSESYIHSHNAACFSANFQDLVHPALVSGTGLTDRGQHVAQLAVCGGSVSAVLLEVGFIDSESDMKTYQARKAFVAQEIARGIVGR